MPEVRGADPPRYWGGGLSSLLETAAAWCGMCCGIGVAPALPAVLFRGKRGFPGLAVQLLVIAA